jgi:hypothetical protein
MAKKPPKIRKKDLKPPENRPPARKRDVREAFIQAQLEDKPKPVIVELGPRLPYKAKHHCELVRKLGGEGASESQMAIACGLSRREFKRWRREHEEFDTAVEQALTMAEAHWEHRWIGNMDRIGHNANAYKHMMASRFRETYGEKVQVSGDEEAPLTVITRRIVRAPKRGSDGS